MLKSFVIYCKTETGTCWFDSHIEAYILYIEDEELSSQFEHKHWCCQIDDFGRNIRLLLIENPEDKVPTLLQRDGDCIRNKFSRLHVERLHLCSFQCCLIDEAKSKTLRILCFHLCRNIWWLNTSPYNLITGYYHHWWRSHRSNEKTSFRTRAQFSRGHSLFQYSFVRKSVKHKILQYFNTYTSLTIHHVFLSFLSTGTFLLQCAAEWEGGTTVWNYMNLASSDTNRA